MKNKMKTPRDTIKPTWTIPHFIPEPLEYTGSSEDFINRIAQEFKTKYGALLCIEPNWFSDKDGEILYPQKQAMFHLHRYFERLNILLSDSGGGLARRFIIVSLMCDFQGLISLISQEAVEEGRKYILDIMLDRFRKGEYFTKELYDDVYNALLKQQDIWRAEREKNLTLQKQMEIVQIKKKGANILADISEEEKEIFIQLAKKAKRFKGGKNKDTISASALAASARRKLRNGQIGGRRVDDKLVARLLKAWHVR